jgi:cyclopropane fatty-acyl-phospholipid synthase-like methyltransferase
MVLNKKFWLKMKAGTTPSSTEIDNDFWKYFKPGDKMLDVGCGWGRAVKECLKRGIKVVGIDINKNEIKALKEQNLKGAEIKCGDILKIKFKEKFNGVLMLGVLCTMEKKERQACLKKVNFLLKDKGYVFISEFETSDKFKERYENDFKITKEYGTLSVKDAGKEVFRSHNFTKEEIYGLLNSSGFKIVKFKRAEFTSYHRDKKPGIMITAQKI